MVNPCSELGRFGQPHFDVNHPRATAGIQQTDERGQSRQRHHQRRRDRDDAVREVAARATRRSSATSRSNVSTNSEEKKPTSSRQTAASLSPHTRADSMLRV